MRHVGFPRLVNFADVAGIGCTGASALRQAIPFRREEMEEMAAW